MSKNTKPTKTTTNPTTTSDESGAPQIVRKPGDGSRMLSAAELAQEHGADVLDENARKAATIRSQPKR